MCDYCASYGNETHDERCPLYEPTPSDEYGRCALCGENIYTGEVVLALPEAECVHEACFAEAEAEELYVLLGIRRERG